MTVQRRISLIAALTIAGVTALVLTLRLRSITLEGAVLVQDTDPRKQTPIEGATVSAADSLGRASATTDFSGFFRITLRRTVVSGEALTLQVRHQAYQPRDMPILAGDELYIVHLVPVRADAPPPRVTEPEVLLSDLVVRYSVQDKTATNIGSGVKAFEVVNSGNVACDHHPPCSPDGRWKAAVAGVSLDAGADNEFGRARLSCIAGPCAFTRVDTDGYSRGGRQIGATVRAWSDTATFVLEAEVFRPQISNLIQRAYPIILGRRLNFTMAASAEGPSIQAEVNGMEIVFPLGPDASLSWATCLVLSERDQTKVYRCELKPGYAFKDSRD